MKSRRLLGRNHCGAIRELLDYDGETGKRRLTEWEINFLGSIETQAEVCLSEKQMLKLWDIYEEIF